MTVEITTDVLIIGTGPAGSTCAALLATLYVGFCGPALHIRSVAGEWTARLTPWHRSPRTRFWPHSFMLC
jgi:hypothetical protein